MSPIERLPDGSTWWVPADMRGGAVLPEAQIGPFGPASQEPEDEDEQP